MQYRLRCSLPTPQAIDNTQDQPEHLTTRQGHRDPGWFWSLWPCWNLRTSTYLVCYSYIYVCVADVWQEIANPCFGAGPSTAGPCPGPNYVWFGNTWCQVVNRMPYNLVTAATMPARPQQ